MNRAQHRRIDRPFAALLALLLATASGCLAAQALSPAFTYQGELRLASGPANGGYDMQFLLYSAPSGGAQIGPTVTANAVQVSGGLFSVPLDFGPAQFAGDRQWLEIRIRPAGSGSFETLSPRSEVTAAPYAWGAAIALANSVTTTSIVDGTIGSADINAAQVQRRVTGTCPAGEYLRAINQNGTVSCGTDANSGGTVTSIATGAGLTGGPITASGTIAVAAGGIGSTQINASQVQRRVSGSCTGANYVQLINLDGSVSCGAAPAPGWSLSGDAGTDPDTNFIGTTDNQALVLRVNNQQALRIEPRPSSPNLIAGFSGNTVTAGVLGATIGGGGLSLQLNRVTDNFGTVSGGFSNRAGDDAGTPSDSALATVGGGGSNIASGSSSAVAGGSSNRASGLQSIVGGGGFNRATGRSSTVGGGEMNEASGEYSSVGGGRLNCAGGDYSWAGGLRAKVRPGSEPASGYCTGLTPPGGGGDQGTFVWADSQSTNFISAGENQFLVRASGSVQFTHDNDVTGNGTNWFRIRAPADRDPLLVTAGSIGVLRGFSNGGVRIGHPTSWLSPIPGTSGLVVMGNARRNDNQRTWDTTSDARVKHEVETLEGAIDTLLALRPTRFRYHPEFLARQGAEDRTHLGFIAQELAEVLPESVHLDDSDAAHVEGLLSVNLSDVHVLTTAATRELAIQQRALEAEVVDLRVENSALRAELMRRDAEYRNRLERLEALLIDNRARAH